MRGICAARAIIVALTLAMAGSAGAQDWRNIRNGETIPSENYADQPYVVELNDGSWLTTLTTGPGHEGSLGQHVVSSTSTDQGHSWTPLVDIEPSVTTAHLEASWVVPLHVPTLGDPDKGRVYGFYTYNGDQVNVGRSDTVGWYAMKYTDDGGQTWSTQRYRVPVPYTEIDVNNSLSGLHMLGWGVSKPVVHDGDVYIGFTKVRRPLVDNGEGWVFKSSNLLTESDPANVTWEFFGGADNVANNPPGGFATDSAIQTISTWNGIKAPTQGATQEEHVVAPLEQPGHLALVNRTQMGYPLISYTRDGGDHWTNPEPLTYEPDGTRVIKNPRANAKLWRMSDGEYLLWHDFNGTTSFNNRNPAWLSAGTVDDAGMLHFSQPELLLYDPNTSTRMSYPDLIEIDGQFWITETQKSIARSHPIDGGFLDTLLTWETIDRLAVDGKQLDLGPGAAPLGTTAAMPTLPSLTDGGFTADFWLELDSVDAGQIIADTRDAGGRGLVIRTASSATMEILLSDGADTASWTTDAGTLEAGRPQHVGVVVDGAANVITWVVDGELLDGGIQRDFGWTFFSGNVGDVNGADRMTLANGLDGTLQRFRLYDRYLMTTELIGNYRAGPSAVPEPSTVILVLITLIVAAGARGRACGGRRR